MRPSKQTTLRPLSILLLAIAPLTTSPCIPTAWAQSQDNPAFEEPALASKHAAVQEKQLAAPKFASVTTTVRFRQEGAAPHTLITIYHFPNQSRWWFGLVANEFASRRIIYRNGETSYLVDLQENASRKLLGLENLDALIQSDLRAALYQWPHGFAWEGEGRVRKVHLGARGELAAILDEAGTLTSISSYNAESKLLESYGTITWGQAQGRTWPMAFTFSAGQGPLWDEEVKKVNFDGQYVSSVFIPPDQRKVHGRKAQGSALPGAREKGVPRATELDSFIYQRMDLPDGVAWKGAIKLAAKGLKERAIAGVSQGRKLSNTVTFEVGPDGGPRAVRFKLLGMAEQYDGPPKGWSLAPLTAGVYADLKAPGEANRKLLSDLKVALGDKAGATGTPYVLLTIGARNGGAVMLILPLEASR